MLRRAVVAFGGHGRTGADPVVKETGPAANHCLGRPVLPAADRPCKSDARCEIGHIVDVGLGLVAQAKAQGEGGLEPPIVEQVDPQVSLINRRQRVAPRHGELAGSAAQCTDLVRSVRVWRLLQNQRPPVAFERRFLHHLRLPVRTVHDLHLIVQHGRLAADEGVSAIEVGGGNVANVLDTDPAAPFERVWTSRVGRHIADLVKLIRVGGYTCRRSAAIEGVRYADGRQGADDAVLRWFIPVLKTRLGQGFAAENRSLGEEEMMFSPCRVNPAIGQGEPADPLIVAGGVLPLIPQGESVPVVNRNIHLGRELHAHGGRRHRLLHRRRLVIAIQDGGVDHSKFGNIPPLEIHSE